MVYDSCDELGEQREQAHRGLAHKPHMQGVYFFLFFSGNIYVIEAANFNLTSNIMNIQYAIWQCLLCL